MHPALLVPDILCVIFSLLLEDGRSSALALSLTAKAFLETGVEYIWEELSDLRPLFGILQNRSSNHTQDKAFEDWSPPSEAQWRRFDFYGTKVRRLRASVGERYQRSDLAPWEKAYRLHIPISFLMGLARGCSSPLPDLRVLELSGDADCVPPIASILLSPTVSTLRLSCDPTPSINQQDVEYPQDNFLKSLEEACLHLTSLRLSGIFMPEDPEGRPLTTLEWSKIFPLSLTDVTLERDLFESPLVVEHLCRLPNLLRLEVGPDKPHDDGEPCVIGTSSFPVLVDLTTPVDIIPTLVRSLPQVRRITTRISPWSIGRLSQDGAGIHSLRPQLEKACPQLESFTVVLTRERFMICGTAMFARIKNIQTLESAWNKIKVEYEPFDREG